MQRALEGQARALSLVMKGLSEAQTVSSVPMHRVVMLAPPNQGGYVAEILSGWALAGAVLGPVLTQLSPQNIRDVSGLHVSCIIVAGTYAPLSLGTGPSDGVIRVEETKLVVALITLGKRKL